MLGVQAPGPKISSTFYKWHSILYTPAFAQEHIWYSITNACQQQCSSGRIDNTRVQFPMISCKWCNPFKFFLGVQPTSAGVTNLSTSSQRSVKCDFSFSFHSYNVFVTTKKDIIHWTHNRESDWILVRPTKKLSESNTICTLNILPAFLELLHAIPCAI